MNNRPWRINRDRVFNFGDLRKKLDVLPGLGVCLVIVLAAYYVAGRIGGPAILYSLMLGIVLRQISDHPAYRAGLEFCAGTALRIGIALLGARITFNQIADFGLQPAALLLAVPSTILFSVLIARYLKLDKSIAVISGCAVAICGAAAALAVAATLPKNSARENAIVPILMGIATLSTVAMLTYPPLTVLWGWPAQHIGLFLGATIHDVAHVIGASYMVSQEVGDTATFMKMLRVATLIPIVILLSCVSRRRLRHESKPQVVPGFLVAFVVLMLFANLDIVSNGTKQALSNSSGTLLLLAMAANGTRVRFDAFWRVGKKTILLLVLNTLFIALFSVVILSLTK